MINISNYTFEKTGVHYGVWYVSSIPHQATVMDVFNFNSLINNCIRNTILSESGLSAYITISILLYDILNIYIAIKVIYITNSNTVG